jgi:hypothetical protein
MNIEQYLYLFAEDTSLYAACSIEVLQVAMNFLCHKLQTSGNFKQVVLFICAGGLQHKGDRHQQQT